MKGGHGIPPCWKGQKETPGKLTTCLLGCRSDPSAKSRKPCLWVQGGKSEKQIKKKKEKKCQPQIEQSQKSVTTWAWLKIKQEGQTAGFGPCFQLPGFRFDTGFLSHSHIAIKNPRRTNESQSRPGIKKVYPNPCQEIERRNSAPMFFWLGLPLNLHLPESVLIKIHSQIV